MPLVVGIDLGTTKTTAIAVDVTSGNIVAQANSATVTNMASAEDQQRGRSEFDVNRLTRAGIDCLKQLGLHLDARVHEIIGIGITGQQHGMVLVDADRKPLTPFINWQDQRGQDVADATRTFVEVANERIGLPLTQRTGCRLRTGFLATTLFWLKQHQRLPQSSRACFLMDYFASVLTDGPLVTDPSCAGSAGVFDVPTRSWNADALRALQLEYVQLSEVHEAHEEVGKLTSDIAAEIGWPAGVPVFVPIGDHQACFLGSVADRFTSALLNVGTGAQVAVFTTGNEFHAPIELRPFPISGNLLSFVGLTGGWSFQVVEKFVRQIGERLFGQPSDAPLYGALTELAASAPSGCNGLSLVPTFSGTRADPLQRGTMSGMSAQNLTPGHFIRALFEGMARDYRQANDLIASVTKQRKTCLVTAGNGLRENALLSQLVAQELELPLLVTQHREEAAFGACLVACVGSGVFRDLHAAGSLIRHQ